MGELIFCGYGNTTVSIIYQMFSVVCGTDHMYQKLYKNWSKFPFFVNIIKEVN